MSDPLAGTWYSGIGSQLDLQVNGSQVSGTFTRKGTQGKVIGSVDPDPTRPNRALSFSVAWVQDVTPPQNFVSVTSYTGQYHKGEKPRPDVINAVFLLVDETSAQRQFASTFVGYDNFFRQKPTPEQIEQRKLLG